MKENIEKKVIGLFVVMLLILAGIAWAAMNNIRLSADKTALVNHTHAVILQANAISIHLHTGDAAMSAYLITGDARDQANYRSAYGDMVNDLVKAQAYTRRNAQEQGVSGRFLELEKLIAKHITFTKALVQARQTPGGFAAAQKEAQDHPEGQSTTDIDRVIREINQSEEDVLSQRDQEAVIQATNTQYIVYSGVVLNFFLLVFITVLLRDDLQARRIAATALEDANAQLEAKVQERTAELVKTNQTLKKENLERRWSYQALDHQLRYNQLIVNSIDEMVFVISKALNVSRVNPAVAHFTNWQPEDLISQSLERVLQLPPDGPTHPIITALNEGREIQERTAMVVTKTGTTMPVRFNLFPLRDDNKVVGGVITVHPAPGTPLKPG